MIEVVLLDDDRRQFVALERACSTVGIQLHHARSAAEAASLSRRGQASLVVVTEKLSNAQGFPVAQSIAPTPTVVCSEALTSTTVFEAVGSGAYDCLAKPLEVESILAVKAHSQLKLIGLLSLLMRFAEHLGCRDSDHFSEPA